MPNSRGLPCNAASGVFGLVVNSMLRFKTDLQHRLFDEYLFNFFIQVGWTSTLVLGIITITNDFDARTFTKELCFNFSEQSKLSLFSKAPI